MAQPAPTPRIASTPGLMSGKPVIAGTRIPVEIVLCRIADGYTMAVLVEDWPHFTAEDIKAAITYAAFKVAVPEPEPA